jgi:hypothetical protein
MQNRYITFSALGLALAMTASCGQPNAEAAAGAQANSVAPAVAVAAPAPACAPGDAKLPVTGLCQAQATALLLAASGAQATAPEGCSWSVEEAAMTDRTALLYRGARCKERSTKLKFVPGTPLGRFLILASPYEDAPADDAPLASLTLAENPAALLGIVRAQVKDPAERARCQLRPAAIEGWPADAQVVDEVPPPPADGVRSACGPLGLDEDSQTFWRLSQNRAWFFELGQESAIVDPGSFTIVNKDKSGAWLRA